jgi:Icc-related predicted phosphoesterase
MKLLVFSDIHSDLKSLERLMETDADYYFAAGDLCSWGRALEAAGEIMKPRADRVYVIPGNHETSSQISAFSARYGCHDFHGRRIEVGRYHVAGLGYSSPTPFDTPGEYTEDELATRLLRFAGLQPLVMICHAPPYGTALDQVRDGAHAGSTSVRDFIAAEQPEYFFCGHIHEAAGTAIAIGKTTAVNVGKKGYLLQLE